MPFPASGQNVKLGKGSMLLGLYDDNGVVHGFDFVGNATALSLSGEATNVELYSSTEKTAPLIDRARTRVAYTLTVTLNEFTVANLKAFLLGTENTKAQASGSSQTYAIDNVVLGRYYQCGDRQITSAVLTNGTDAMVLGTDYTLNAEFGVVHILPDAPNIVADDDLVLTYDRPALTITQVRLARAGQITAHLLYLSDDANSASDVAKDRLECWKVDVAPEGELGLISEDYASYSLTMAILSDADNHPNDPYGTLDRVTG